MPQPAEKAPRNEAHSDIKTKTMAAVDANVSGSTMSPPPKRSNDCQIGKDTTQTKNTGYKAYSENGANRGLGQPNHCTSAIYDRKLKNI